MSKVIVVGGGAAGMMAAVFAAENGHHVQIYEKNDRLGRKLFITGKGRCNITNASDVEELFQAVVSNPKFLYSAFYSFTNEQVIDFFENLGVKTKVERGNRVFPVSDPFVGYNRGASKRTAPSRRSDISLHGSRKNMCRKRENNRNHYF